MAEGIAVPALLGPAVSTLRPELVRIVAAGQVTVDDAEKILAFGEAIVESMASERRVYAVMDNALADAVHNLKGSLGFVERLREAVRGLEAGRNPAEVEAMLRNPNRKAPGGAGG